MAQPRANEPAELKVRYKKEVDLKENRDAVAWQVLTEICKTKYEHLLTAFEDGAPDERCHQAWDHIVEWFEGQDDAPTRQRRIFEQAVTLRVKETGDPKQLGCVQRSDRSFCSKFPNEWSTILRCFDISACQGWNPRSMG